MTRALAGPDLASEQDPTDVVMSVPELLFDLEPLTFAADGKVAGFMPTGPWMADPQAGPSGLPGTLGVLVDDVLGYAINAVADVWSVSTEISIDVVGKIPTDGSRVRAEGRVVHRAGTSVLALSRVVDESGETIAYARERGRLIEGAPGPDARDVRSRWTLDSVVPASIARLFGPDVVLGDAGAHVGVSSRMANPLGNLHGGMSLCLTEWLATRATPGLARTSSIQMQYVRPLPQGTDATAHVTVEHGGRSLAVLRVVIADPRGKACTIGQAAREGHAA